MKKHVALILSLLLVIGLLAGCSEKDANSGEKVYQIGICQIVEHPALDAATKGFTDKITEKLGDKVVLDVQNAQGEQTNTSTIINAFVADKKDLIVANATGPLQAAASATQETPILGTSVTDYATALGITEGWDGTTGRNISGTSDCAPLDQQEDMLIDLFPNVKKVGILYCSAEANSKYQADVFGAALAEDNVEYEVYTIADTNDIQSIVSAAVQECDVLYIPTDNTLASNTEAVNNIALPAGVPIICGEEGICSGCGVATLSIDYYSLGEKTAEMAYEILVNGADVSAMKIEYAEAVTKKYNKENCEKLGITVPDDYVAIGD